MWVLFGFLACDGFSVDPSEAASEACPDGPPLNATITTLDASSLTAALPEAAGRWRRATVFAGDGVSTATYTPDGQRADGPPGLTPAVRVVVEDRIHRCTGAAGTGAAMLAQLAALPDHAATRLGERPAVTARAAGIVQMDLWLADRCAASIGASSGMDDGLSVSGADLQDVADAIDWAALERACAAR